jgi:hypothetical protein
MVVVCLGLAACTHADAPSDDPAPGQTLACPDGLTRCGELCADVQQDRDHCGSCANACLGGEACVAGSCEDSAGDPPGEDPPADSCDGVACDGHGSCVMVDQTPTCECESGYYANGLSCVDTPPLGSTDSQGRTLVFADEFDGTELDPAAWTADVGIMNGRGREAYLTDRPANLRVENGSLQLIAQAEEYEGRSYTTGSISTSETGWWKYGRIEARIRVAVGAGCWPAFWMMPKFGVYGPTPPRGLLWPGNGEIDIMEVVSQHPTRHHAAIHFVESDAHEYAAGRYTHDASLDADFHVYAIEWDASEIRWHFDDNEFFSFDVGTPIDGRLPFQEDFYIILNLAVGGGWPEPPDPAVYPQTMYVDWVRVWQ